MVCLSEREPVMWVQSLTPRQDQRLLCLCTSGSRSKSTLGLSLPPLHFLFPFICAVSPVSSFLHLAQFFVSSFISQTCYFSRIKAVLTLVVGDCLRSLDILLFLNPRVIVNNHMLLGCLYLCFTYLHVDLCLLSPSSLLYMLVDNQKPLLLIVFTDMEFDILPTHNAFPRSIIAVADSVFFQMLDSNYLIWRASHLFWQYSSVL